PSQRISASSRNSINALPNVKRPTTERCVAPDSGRSFSSAAGTAPPAEETSDEAIGDASRRGRLPVLPGVFLSVIAEPGGVLRHRAGGPPRAVEPLQEIAPAVHPAIERLGRS